MTRYQKFARRLRRAARRELTDLLIKQDHQCHWCARLIQVGVNATIDHVWPISDGGGNRGNIVGCLWRVQRAEESATPRRERPNYCVNRAKQETQPPQTLQILGPALSGGPLIRMKFKALALIPFLVCLTAAQEITPRIPNVHRIAKTWNSINKFTEERNEAMNRADSLLHARFNPKVVQADPDQKRKDTVAAYKAAREALLKELEALNTLIEEEDY